MVTPLVVRVNRWVRTAPVGEPRGQFEPHPELVHGPEVAVVLSRPDAGVETLAEDAFETGDPTVDPKLVATQPRPRGAVPTTVPSLLEAFMPTDAGGNVVFGGVDSSGLNWAPPVAVLVVPP
jgi:hypothetical protein